MTAKKYRSDPLRSLHLAAEDLHAVGALDQATMETFDVACLKSPRKRRKTFRVGERRHRLHSKIPIEDIQAIVCSLSPDVPDEELTKTVYNQISKSESRFTPRMVISCGWYALWCRHRLADGKPF